MIGATIVNVIVMFAIFLALFVLLGRFVAPHFSPGVNQILLLVVFIGAMVLTYFLYHRVMRYLASKYDLEKYFEPIFRKSRKPPQE
jgi:membrane protein YdbS with pleckstrin-like domain